MPDEWLEPLEDLKRAVQALVSKGMPLDEVKANIDSWDFDEGE